MLKKIIFTIGRTLMAAAKSNHDGNKQGKVKEKKTVNYMGCLECKDQFKPPKWVRYVTTPTCLLFENISVQVVIHLKFEINRNCTLFITKINLKLLSIYN